jgi:hypothetical protein
MREERSTVQLAEEAPFDVATRGVTATLRRSDIEAAAHAGEAPAELQLDVRWGGGTLEEAHVLAVEWSQADLDRLLASTTADPVMIAFDGNQMAAAINAAADVEAHGLRDKAIVLTVVAVTALGSAGVAQAHPAGSPAGGGAPAVTIGGALAGPSIAPATSPATVIGGAGVTAAPVVTSPATTIGGAGPAPTEPVTVLETTAATSSPQTPAQVAIRGDAAARTVPVGDGSSLPSGGDAILVGAAGLAIAAAGFAAVGTRRKTIRPA